MNYDREKDGPDMKMSAHPGPAFPTVRDGVIPVRVDAQNYSVIRFPMQ